MSQLNEDRIKWIKKVCWIMESFTLGVLGFTVLLGILHVCSLVEDSIVYSGVKVGFASLIIWIKIKILYHIKVLFSLYKMGQIFTKKIVRQFKGIGSTLFLGIGVYSINAISLGVLKGNLDQQGYIAGMIFVGFLTALPYLFFATVVWLASWVMEEAILLKEDVDLTI